MKFKVKCPVCNASLEWDQSGDASYGIITVEDLACVELTIQDPSGVVYAHLEKHRQDGTWIESWKAHKQRQKQGIENLIEGGLV